MFAGYNNDYRESKDNYNRKSMLPLLKCQITPLGVITHRLRTTALTCLVLKQHRCKDFSFIRSYVDQFNAFHLRR